MPICDFWMQVRPNHIPPFDRREAQVTLGTPGIAWVYFAYQIYRRVQRPLFAPEQRVRDWALWR
jgi:hypothetical protein